MVTTQALYTTDEPELGYGQLFSVLSRRAVWLGGAIAGGLGVAFVLTLQEDPVHTSSMRLLVEPNYRQSVDITQESDPNRRTDTQIDYATQLNLMRSQGFIEQTVEELLTTYPDLCGNADVPRCARQFKGDLNLSQIIEDEVETRIFEIQFSGEDPDFVQDFLQTLGKIYLTYNVEQQELRLEQGLSLVNEQIAQMETRLNSSRQQLKQFRENQNLISPQQQAETLTGTLSQLGRTQIDVENQYQAAQAQVAALQQQLAADPQTALTSSRLSQSSRYQQLLNALQQTELALEERRAVYTDADAGVQDLLSQRQGQVALLQEEVYRVLGEVPAQINLDERSLLTEGQLGGIELTLVNDLVQAQVELQSLAARRAGLAQSEQQLRSELNQLPSLIAEFDRIQPEIETQQQALDQLLQIRQELSNELAQGGFTWEIVETPDVARQIAPQPTKNLILGLIAGAFLGGALAFGREAIDNVVRTSDELKKQTALPLLGVLPYVSPADTRALPKTAQAASAIALVHHQPFRNAIDLIYKTLQLTNEQPLSSLMVTSATDGEGKTTLAIGLALTAARLHKRVLLIDTDLRHPSLHSHLGMTNDQGLSNYIQAGQTRFAPIALTLAGTTIDVMPAGPVPSDPVQLLSSRSAQQLLAYAESAYDLVILDTPAILGSADVLQLASLCKAGVMVSRLDRTTQDDLTEAAALVSSVNMLGVVANKYQDGRGLESSHRANAAPTAGGRSLGTSLAHLVTSPPWRRWFTASSVGAGMVMAGPLMRNQGPAALPSANPEPPSPQAPAPAAAVRPSRATADGSAVASLHLPQWS